MRNVITLGLVVISFSTVFNGVTPSTRSSRGRERRTDRRLWWPGPRDDQRH